MDMNKYQELASRTRNSDLREGQEFTNYALGLSGESGEYAELVKKVMFHHHDIGIDEFTKELGDVLWYVSQLARLHGASLSYIAEQNIHKLQTRYPEKFTIEDSIARVDTEEQG